MTIGLNHTLQTLTLLLSNCPLIPPKVVSHIHFGKLHKICANLCKRF